MRNGFAAIVALCALAMSGCAIVDEGAVDYRRSKLADPGTTPEITALDAKYLPLDSKYRDAFITRDDYYYITLKQGVIQEFWELFGHLEGAEIAIVATVFEVGDVDEKGNQIKFDFSPSAIQKARVIFYSDDVERGQPLNLSQLPIYGPVKYKQGNSVAVQLYVMELDQISERTKALLKEMARLASMAASGAASPAAGKGVDVLTNLALAFLNGNHDDMIFRFDMTFAPQFETTYVPQDYLTEGQRIFVRQKERDLPFDWSKVSFEPTTGRLMKEDPTDPKKSVEYRDNTYFVMDVLKLRNVAGDLSQANFLRLSELIEDIKKSGSFAKEDLDNLRASVTGLINTVNAERSVETSLQDIFDPILPESQRSATALDLLDKFKKSLNEADPTKREFSADLIDKSLRFMWKRIGERKPDPATILAPTTLKVGDLLQRLTAAKLKGETDLAALANGIAAIYRK